MTEDPHSRDEQGKVSGTPVLEWIAAAVGLVLTLTMLGFIGRQVPEPARDEPPALQVRVERISEAAQAWVVEVTVENLSPTTAAAVQIEGALQDGEQVIATSQGSFDYVPGHSSRRGGLLFEQDPRGFELTVRALGYADP